MNYGHLKRGNLELVFQLTMTLGMAEEEKIPLADRTVGNIDSQVGFLCVLSSVVFHESTM